jgi:CRP-like cAMP-binding protein
MEGIARLTERGHPRSFPMGSLLMQQGEPADTMYVILSGRVRVERTHPDLIEPVVLADLGPGEVVGEMGLLDGQPRSATVTAVEDTETLEMDAADLSYTVLRYPEASMALLQTISRRLRSIDELAAQLASQSGPRRRRRRRPFDQEER